MCSMQASRQILAWWALAPTPGTLYAGRPRTAAWWASGRRSACPAGALFSDWQPRFAYVQCAYIWHAEVALKVQWLCRSAFALWFSSVATLPALSGPALHYTSRSMRDAVVMCAWGKCCYMSLG